MDLHRLQSTLPHRHVRDAEIRGSCRAQHRQSWIRRSESPAIARGGTSFCRSRKRAAARSRKSPRSPRSSLLRGARAPSSRTVSKASRLVSRIFCAYVANTLPATVNEIRFPKRSKSCVSSSCSICRICALIAGCVRKHERAAFEKLFRRTISRNACNWSKSMRGVLPYVPGMFEKQSLHFSPRGETKCVRGPSGRGASRLARAGVLEQYIEHGKQAQRGHGGRIACFGRQMMRYVGWPA